MCSKQQSPLCTAKTPHCHFGSFPEPTQGIYLVAHCDTCLSHEASPSFLHYQHLIRLASCWHQSQHQFQQWLWRCWLGCEDFRLYKHVCISQYVPIIVPCGISKCTFYCHSLYIPNIHPTAIHCIYQTYILLPWIVIYNFFDRACWSGDWEFNVASVCVV